jgi:hypothetical protein
MYCWESCSIEPQDGQGQAHKVHLDQFEHLIAEQGFKITKRAGWQWHRTRMTDPERAAWLAVAVGTLWLRSVGGAAEETNPASTLLDVTALCPGQLRSRQATRLRLMSVFRQGWVALLVALLQQEPLP